MSLSRLTLAILLGAIFVPGAAHAESGVDGGPYCRTGTLSPSVERVPANLPGWRVIGSRFVDGPGITLHQHVGSVDEPREIDVITIEDGYLIRPLAPLMVGGDYLLVVAGCEGYGDSTIEREFSVDPAVSVPMTLGITTVSELFSSRRRPGALLRYFVNIELELSDEARAAAALYESTEVFNDRPGLATWSLPPLRDRRRTHTVNCDEDRPSAMVSIRLEHWARLPDEESSVWTEPVVVAYRCADAVRVDPTSGDRLTPEEIVEMDRIPDAGPPAMDAGGGIDAGTILDGSLQPDVSGMEPVQGCSCRATGGTGTTPWLAFGALAWLVSRRNRRGQRL